MKVAVILVNWNRPGDTLECLRSLWNSTYKGCEIVVVDNGSRNDSPARLRLSQGPFVLLEAGKNLGFTGGNNLGMRYALDNGCDFILLLNNDTIIAPEAIERLVQAAEVDSTIGAVSPKILFYSPPERIWFAGAKFDSRFLVGRMAGYGQKDSGQFEREEDIPFASGCAMLIRRRAIEVAGLLDEDFFAVMEDIDYSLRISRQGYRIRYVPTALVWHKESVSAGGHDAPQYVYYQMRNMILLQHKWARGPIHRLAAGNYALLYFFYRALRLAAGRKWLGIVGLCYGMRDGLLGITGRRRYNALDYPKAIENAG